MRMRVGETAYVFSGRLKKGAAFTPSPSSGGSHLKEAPAESSRHFRIIRSTTLALHAFAACSCTLLATVRPPVLA